MILGGSNEVTASSQEQDTRIVGVVTTKPAHLMNSALQGEFVAGIALRGRVPCKVIGKVSAGDVIVSSNEPGFGMSAADITAISSLAVIGKAITSKDTEEPGMIEIVV